MQWFERLDVREQRVIFLGVLVIVFSVGYFMVWEPFQQAYTELSGQVQAQQETLVWMQQAATEVQQLRKQAPAVTNRPSLLSVIDKSVAQNAALVKAQRRIEPKDEYTIQINFENVSFTQLLTWLGQLDRQYQIQVNMISVTRQSSADQVNTRLILQRLK